MNIDRDITLTSKKYLLSDDILIYTGPRQSGKTTILKQLRDILLQKNHTCYFLNLEDPDYLSLLKQSPKNLFKIFPFNIEKRNFVFIDEIQYLENPSNFLKYIYDEYKGKIKLIVSESSAFYLDKKFKDSLAGRKKIFNVRTLSFKEFLRFKKLDESLLNNPQKLSLTEKNLIISQYGEYMVFGGYPRLVLSPLEEKQEILHELAYSYIKKDIFEANLRQNEIFYKLFKILARQIGTLVNSSELATTLGTSKTAIDNYLYIMQKSFHICLVKPFYKNIRKELSKMPKVYFLDMGLRNFFAGNFESWDVRLDQGSLLENATFRQFIENNFSKNINFWRTIQKNEIDFILNGKEAFEVKVNSTNFKSSQYALFLKNYPDIPLSIISFNIKNNLREPYEVKEVWEI